MEKTMDRLEAMTMLLVVVEKGSLSAAGRSLGVPVPTLSRKISDLEDVMNTRLLIRTTRKLTLTDAGLTYVGAARRILEQVEEAEREAAGEFTAPKGELIVTAPMVFGRMYVLPVVTDFLALFPEISVRLLLTDRNLQLVDEHVDLAIRVGKLPDSAMIATRVGSMRMVVCASRALLAGHGVPTTPEDLQHLPSVAFNWLASSAIWQFKGSDAGAPVEISVAPRLSVSTAEAAVEAAIPQCRGDTAVPLSGGRSDPGRRASNRARRSRTGTGADPLDPCRASPDAAQDALLPRFCETEVAASTEPVRTRALGICRSADQADRRQAARSPRVIRRQPPWWPGARRSVCVSME
jgi:DNA-binding transcriptional LysR family regulator